MSFLTKILFTHNNTRRLAKLIRYTSTSNTVNYDWKLAVRDGEKVVGYPTSFMNLRWLLTDEISNIASYISKLIGTKHPMVQVARDLLHQSDTAKWGLIILLISKAAGIKPGCLQTELDGLTGILHSQRSLAEITEMIKTGHQMHNTMVNLKLEDKNYEKLQFGNKLALLSGDYLYSKSFKELALLNNNELNEIIATSLRDLSQAEFIQQRDKYDKPIPCRPNRVNSLNQILNSCNNEINPRDEWILRNTLGSVSLLAKSCKGALILGGHSEEFQEIGFALGKNLGLAWQCMEELKPFIHDTSLPFSLNSAPVLFQLHEEPELFELFEDDNILCSKIREKVIQGKGLVEASNLLRHLTTEAMNTLDYFPTNDAQYSLIQMVNALSMR